jgi:hypothetical protein
MISFAIKFSKPCNFGSSRWIFLKMENAYSLVCNVWKVHTRPTSASDFLFVINPKIRFMLKVSTNFSNFYREKFDALVGRVSAFHIMQTCELTLFPERHRKYPKLQNLRIML